METGTVSPAEAAFVTELPRKTIEQAIDRDEVQAALEAGARTLGLAELVYLHLRRDLARTLSPAARREVYQQIRDDLLHAGQVSQVEMGPVVVDILPAAEEVRERLAQLNDARDFVVSDPAVRGGEPVVRGTRVPVHMLAELATQGATLAEMLEDFPGVSTEALEAALLYAEVHPRRGRPRRAPWREIGEAKDETTPRPGGECDS